MTQAQYCRLREGDRWVALRQIQNEPVTQTMLSSDLPAQEARASGCSLLRQVHLRHDTMVGNRHT